MPKHLQGGQTQRISRFELALVDRLYTGSHNFRSLSPQIGCQSNQSRLIRRHSPTQGGNAEKNEEQLHQERRIANDFNIDSNDIVERYDAEGLTQGTNNSD